MPHHRVWLFVPPPDRHEEFRKAYGADGDWARLFASSEAFLGTRLLRACEPAGWWMTIDSWASEAAFDQFHARHGPAYRRLDSALEGVAGEERFVGAFDD